ncbi:MAG TPA: ATP-dependent DNA ligase [Steroidobacter sp.]|uniref:ATP-dependent DNA ligase n=1 Tax=Steroidobacter sp. TaxID=1978227 RepID=UPI002ED981A6
MRAFAALFEELDTTQSTNLKVAAMSRYFREAPPADAAWAVYILSGRRLKRFIGPALLKRWLIEEAALPEWLIDESYSSVGDLAETIALLTAGTAHSEASSDDTPLADWIEERLLPLREASEDVQRQTIAGWWRELPYRQCFLLNKLLTGELRVGVSQLLVTRALADVTGIERTELAGRLMGEWQPGALFWQALHAAESPRTDPAVPYPFFLASPLEGDPSQLGERDAWQAEWKWDGIRGQLIRRAAECHLWSRGEERITERFPEIVDAAASLPDGVVLDGEVVAWKDGRVQPFALLQQRIGRKKLTAAILATVPVEFLAYDLLELEGRDLRSAPLRERREHLERLLAQASPLLQVSPLVTAPTWEDLAAERADSRQRNVEGLMLKALDSSYGTGRQRGAWWKWKIDPHSFDAVMIYAQPGQGRRSNLYTDYTFGVWRDQELVPVAKAYSGLSNPEIEQLDRWIRAHTLEKFGPVRSVEPSQVFELAYEGIAASGRHKSGIALRFPRILRWRTDKPAAEADTLANLQAMLTSTTGAAPDASHGSS